MLVIKLPPGMELSQNELDPRKLMFWVNVDRHASTIIDNLNGTIRK